MSMPKKGTPEYDELMARRAANGGKPVTPKKKKGKKKVKKVKQYKKVKGTESVSQAQREIDRSRLQSAGNTMHAQSPEGKAVLRAASLLLEEAQTLLGKVTS